MKPMNCEATAKLMSASLDGMLERARQESLDAHLVGCADCRAAFEQLCRTVSLLREVEQVDVPEGLDARICERIRQPAARTPSLNWFNSPQMRVALAAGIALVFGIIAIQNMPPNADEPAPGDVSESAQDELALEEVMADPSLVPDAPSAPEPEPAPAAQAQPAVPAPPPPPETQQPVEMVQRERERPEPADDGAPSPNARHAMAPKRRSDAIWQADEPSVRKGLRVGPSTPLPAAKPAPVARPAPVVAAADQDLRAMADNPREERESADAIRVERAAALAEGMADGKAKAARLHAPRHAVAADAVPQGMAVSRMPVRQRSSAAAPATLSGAMPATGRADLRAKSESGRLLFTVTGVDEKRALALLAAGTGTNEKKRDRGTPALLDRDAQNADAPPVRQPSVTRLANGRISIVASVQSSDLPGILSALGKEGAVRAAQGQSKPGELDGPVLLELLLIP